MMKKMLLLSFGSFLSFSMFGQIPNGDFEAWNSNNGMSIEVPNSPWVTNNLQSKPTGITFNPVTKSTDHFPLSVGNFSLRMENNISITSEPGSQMPYWACAYGFTATAFYPGFNGPVFPITGHPTSLKGYYKFLPQNGDTMQIGIALYKDGILVTQNGFYSTVSVSEWTSFSIDIPTYVDADSAQIGMAAFYSESLQFPAGPYGNSVLFVDNLNFDNLIVGSEDLIEKHFKVYPNPANDEFEIVNLVENGLALIYSVSGELVLKINVSQTQAKIDVSKLKSGLYVLEVQTKSGISQQKLQIQ